MRFGGPILKHFETPEQWLALVREMDYNAVGFPLDSTAPESAINAYASIAAANDIKIAEVGVWNNPLSTDTEVAKTAMQYCKDQLALAEYIGAACCVNIAGSRGKQWDGPHADNYTRETFDRIVDSVREIIDAVKPVKTFYTLEPMPWMYPYSADTYLDLIDAIDRPQFAVHLDTINIINNPYDYFHNAAFTKDCFYKLGPYIKCCHVKDIQLEGNLTVHLNEKPPGQGAFDFKVLIDCLRKLDDVPMLMEHMENQEDVEKAGEFLKKLL